MGKTKSNRLSEKKNAAAKSNPFEKRFTTLKRQIIRPGQDIRKQKQVGKPGQARALAINKRKATLLEEWRGRHKRNSFVDRRIGELEGSKEDAMVARFAAERMRKHNNVFNLDDNDDGEEKLTHFGRNILDIERFDDDPRSDEDDDDNLGHEERKEAAKRKRDEAETHFGGFMTRADIEYSTNRSNSRKEWIESMIAESKRKKAEKIKQQEENFGLTDDLDQQWKKLSASLKGLIKTDAKNKKDGGDNDDYDQKLRLLSIEKGRKVASERSKTETEIITEEKERLERLEKERRRRMGDVDDGQEAPGLDTQVEEEDDEEEVEDGDEDGEEEEDEDDEDADDDDDMEDLKESDEDEPNDEANTKSKEDDSTLKTSSKNKKASKTEAKKTDQAEETSDLPFTFEVPSSYDDLETLLSARKASDQGLILSRMIKCNHPQLGKDNKTLMESLFNFLLQHVNDACIDLKVDILDVCTPFLYDLAHMSPQKAANAVREVLKEKYDEYCTQPKKRLPIDTLYFLKLTFLLFPSSDYRHPVVTPALHFLAHFLSKANFDSRPALTSGLLACCIALEAVSLSHRFLPEVCNFLLAMVFLCSKKNKKVVEARVAPPFKSVGAKAELLTEALNGAQSLNSGQVLSWLDVASLPTSPLDAAFAACCLSTSLSLIRVAMDKWRHCASITEIFAPLPKYLELLIESHKGLEEDKLIKDVKEAVEKLKKNEKKKVVVAKERPKLLKLFDPLVDLGFDPTVKHRRPGRDEKSNELARLQHKVKQAKKAARKDIRADTMFLSAQKAKETRERDLEREQKTKAIMASLGYQEGEFNAMQRKKERSKKAKAGNKKRKK